MGQKSTDIDNINDESLNIDKKKLKEEKYDNIENKKKADKNILRENKMQIREFLDFLEYEKGSSQNTVTGYNRDLIQFFLFVKKDFSKVKQQDIFDYIEHMNEKLRRNSVLRKVSAIKTFYRFCYLNKAIKKDPTGMIKSLKREHSLPEILTL